jgi:hypothetical protein
MHRSPGVMAFTAACVVLLLLAVGAAAVMVALAAAPPALDALRGLPGNPWWFLYHDAPDRSLSAGWRIGAAVAASLLSFAALLRARSIYRRSPSPVIPFVMMFLLSLGLECLRAGSALLAASDASMSFSILLTRVIYWGRFVGLLALLLAGLYRLELKYSRVTVLVGVVFLVSFAMSAYVPVDRTVFLAQLTWKLGDEQSVWFLNAAIEALAILTCLTAAVARRGPGAVLLTAGIALFVVTREVEFFAVQPIAAAAGLAAQAVGSVLCLRGLSTVRK